jgi:hypothetical protein
MFESQVPFFINSFRFFHVLMVWAMGIHATGLLFKALQ